MEKIFKFRFSPNYSELQDAEASILREMIGVDTPLFTVETEDIEYGSLEVALVRAVELCPYIEEHLYTRDKEDLQKARLVDLWLLMASYGHVPLSIRAIGHNRKYLVGGLDPESIFDYPILGELYRKLDKVFASYPADIVEIDGRNGKFTVTQTYTISKTIEVV